MSMRTEDFLLTVKDLPWHSLGNGATFRLLRHNVDTGQYVIVLRLEAGGMFKSHKHYGAAEFYMLKGELSYGDGQIAKAGDYGWESMYALHPDTRVEVDTELFFIGYGPIIFDTPSDEKPMILDGGLLKAISEGAVQASFTA